MYFLIGRFGGPQRVVRRGEVPAVHPVRRPAHAGRRSSGCTSCPAHSTGTGTFDFTDARRAATSTRTRRSWLFLGFFFAFAIKAPLCAVPHLAARRRRARRTPGTAVLLVGVLDKVGTFGMLRYCLPLFPDASQLGHAGGHRAGRHRHHLRRAARDRPDRHQAADRLHLGLALRLHRAGHLRDDHRRARAASTLYMVNHGFSTGRAVPRRRLPDQPARLAPRSPTTAACRRSRRCWPASFLVAGLVVAGAARACRRSSASSSCWSAPSRATPWVGVIATLGIVLAALYILLDVPAHDDRPGAGRRAPRRCHDLARPRGRSRSPRSLVADHRARLLPEAGARRHQPGRRPRHARASAPPTRRRTVGAGRRRDAASERPGRRRAEPFDDPDDRVRRARADAHRVRRRRRRRARRGVRARGAAAVRPSSCIVFAALVGAFVAVVAASRHRSRSSPRARSPSTARRCSCRARSCVLGRCSRALLMAERPVDPAGDCVRRRAPRRCPAPRPSRRSPGSGWLQTEVCPLFLFARRRHAALPGRQRPADDVRRARGALAAAVPAVRAWPAAAGCSRRRRRSSTSCSARSPRRSSSTASRCSTATPASVSLGGDRRRARRPRRRQRPAARRHRRCSSVGLLFKVGAVPFHPWTPDVYQGAPDRRSPASWRAVHQGRRLRRAAARALRRASAAIRWDWRPMMWVIAIAHDGRRLGHRAHPDRHQAACWPTPRSRTPASSSSASSPLSRGGPRAARCSTCVAYGFTTIGAFAIVTLVRDADRRGDAPVAVGRPGQALAASSPASSRCSCWRFAGIPLTSGFTGKFAVFTAGDRAAARRRLVIVGVRRQRRRRVLLRPRHRAHVLHRAGRRRRPDRRRARARSPRSPSRSASRVTLVLGIVPAAGARPGRRRPGIFIR